MGNSALPRFDKRPLFEGYYMPLIEEALKIFMVYVLAHERHQDAWTVRNVALLMFVVGADHVLVISIQANPLDYDTKYNKFIDMYHSWRNHESGYRTSNHGAASALADTLIRRKSAMRPSVELTDSGNTLVSNGLFPRTLSVSDDTKRAVKKFESMPILLDTPLHHALQKGKYRSCYELVDKFYSVSPKNTYHLETTLDDTETLDLDDEDAEPYLPAREACWRPYASSPPASPTKANIPGKHRHIGWGGGGGVDITFPGGGISAGGGGGADFSSDEGETPNSYGSCPHISISERLTWRRLLIYINWFKWLLPVLPLYDNPEQQPILSRNHKSDPKIKKQLSQFTLNKRSVDSGVELSDLENQTSAPQRNGYLRFQRFVFTYFDYNFSSIQKPFEVDYIFQQLNVLATDLNAIDFFAWITLSFLFQAASLLIYSVPYLFTNCEWHFFCIMPLLLISKLFTRNYLHFQCTASTTLVVWLDWGLNMMILVVALYYNLSKC